jgi:predicted O-linked N-acetylglucosamine transferase (SPINDLY family)
VERALAQMQARDYAGAEASLREAERLAPDDVRIQTNLGKLYVRQRRHVEAEVPLSRALALDPANGYALTLLAHIRQRRCAWAGLDQLHAQIQNLLDADRGDTPANFNPWVLMSMPTTPSQQLAATRSYARTLAVAQQPGLRASVSYAPGERLRVGFVSSEFRPHARMALMLGLLERLGRQRLELFAYGTRPRDSGPVGARVERTFEHFADVSGGSPASVAARIGADRIGIVFDLDGYTGSTRAAIFAHRPAPIQVNAIGFQCTLGSGWHDYILTDRFSLPEHLQRFYSERPLYMPHMLYPSDATRRPEGLPPSRAACGLPERGMVFGCFNNSFKILPDLFAIWMRLLHAVPQSVFWLIDASAEAKANLRREAAAAGIDAQRLIFAPRVGGAEHLTRIAAADLFLDTYPYGAHTTANDALLVGLPLLTRAGDTLASRIAGSQLRAIGLPELVTPSFAQYERLARELATQPDLLAGYRKRLLANRDTTPLFDMPRYARDFEDAMLRIWDEHQAQPR